MLIDRFFNIRGKKVAVKLTQIPSQSFWNLEKYPNHMIMLENTLLGLTVRDATAVGLGRALSAIFITIFPR